jgi:hypothetical protein
MKTIRDNYPETVILIYKDRTIIATNKVSEKVGGKLGLNVTLQPLMKFIQVVKLKEL